MKRDGREFDNEVLPKKVQKGDVSNIAVRFLIPARAAGLIIGKGGENIKRIRNQFSVRLNIPDTRGIERVFTIEGALGDICNVWRDIMPKLKDVMSAKLSDPKVIMGQQRFPRRRQQRNQGEGDQPENEDAEEEEKMVDLRLLVHQSIAGCIIGKGGERIRELRQKYQMRVIKVYQMLAPCSTDRVVQLIAEPENAVQCMEAIVEVAENTTIRGPTEPYDASNCSEADALTYGGWLSPEGLQALSQGMPISSGGGGGVGGPGPMVGPGGGGGNRYGGGPPRGGVPPPHPPPPPAMYLARQQQLQQQQQMQQRGVGGPPIYQQTPPPPPLQFAPRGLPPRQQQWGFPDGYGDATSPVGSGGYPGYPPPPPPQQQPQQQQAPPMPVAPPIQQSTVVGAGGVGVGGYDNAGLYAQPPQSTGYNVPPPQVPAGAPPAAAAAMYRMNAPLNNPAAAAAAAAAVAAAAAAATGGGGGGGVGGAPMYGGLAPPTVPGGGGGGGPPQPPAPVPQPSPYGYAMGAAAASGLPAPNVPPPTAATAAGYPPGGAW
ncbi:heterogeneous nuclear ribonucleoprotein k [Echinococcus multilocularis]|uniref:Heterogeneous nuclear ribonucleoprotein k n=1 Tax=Echinococcus multilocularis TaxID=6211 RepID=A0A068Y224_ECHMU|nr:heterogeneous nuclear ribonucleoprotein k [Echinococcus multilocularis]